MPLAPLAERLRPKTLDDYVGQTHLVGEGGIIRRMIESGNVASFILWGPPGVGKTTIARIIANTTKSAFYTLSAVTSGVKDVREVIDRCKRDGGMFNGGGRPILFIDEIHRFSKSQQDSLLGAVDIAVDLIDHGGGLLHTGRECLHGAGYVANLVLSSKEIIGHLLC